MVEIWKENATDEQDKLRSEYAYDYMDVEGGWCDGWAHVLSVDGSALPKIWAEIDNLIESGDRLDSTSRYETCQLARKAFLYHVMNGEPPTVGSSQYVRYRAANFDLEDRPGDGETWKHDEGSALKMHVILEEIKSLDVGRTLRLTSPIHDAAVRRNRNEFVVAETELHGVQRCKDWRDVELILCEWRDECKEFGAPFFDQTMIV